MKPDYRPDIDGLRALAVAAVLLFTGVASADDRIPPMPSGTPAEQARQIVELFPTRIPSLRAFKDDKRWPFARAFLAERFARSEGKPAIFIGASDLWGFGVLDEDEIAASYKRLSGHDAINFSLLAAGSVWVKEAICMLKEMKADVGHVYFSVPFVSDLAFGRLNKVASAKNGLNDIPTARPCEEIIEVTLVDFLADHSFDAEGWKTLNQGKLGRKKDQRFSMLNYKPGYLRDRAEFAAVKPYYKRLIDGLISNATSLPTNATLVISPVFLPGVKQMKFDRKAVEEQIQFIYDTCEVATADHPNLTCYKADWEEDISYFANVSHVNIKGTKRLAEDLYRLASED